MRAAPILAGLLAALALTSAVAVASPATSEELADARLAELSNALPHASQGPASLARQEPTDVPIITGPARLVAKAAALASGPDATGIDAQALHDLALEQQLQATLASTQPLAWSLGRFLPPVPPLPSASAVLAPTGLALAAPARAAVAVLGVASLAALAMPKLPFLPLYSRIEREETMVNSRRAQIYELVRAEPGIHLSDLIRRSGLGWGAAMYHLSVLERNRVLVAHPEGGFKRYFANGQHARGDMARLTALRHEAAKALFEAVTAMPGRSGRELASALTLSPSTLARASERLEEAGLVRRVRAGRKVLYFPAEPAAPAAMPTPVAAA